MIEPGGESRWVPVGTAGDRLHLRRFGGAAGAPAVLMVHGVIANGRVFWTPAGRGLAPYLAARGFDCWALDLRGRGASTPDVGRGGGGSQTDAIVEDLPAAERAIATERGAPPELWLAHSWGGVVALSHLVRFPDRCRSLAGVLCVAVKRRVTAPGWRRRLAIDLMWQRLAPAVAAALGHFPARAFGVGAQNEPLAFLRHSNAWIPEDAPWVDPEDGFDYGRAVASVELPPIWHVAGTADRYLGHPRDVTLFRDECGGPERAGRVTVLSRAAGNLHDYGHADILTSPDAPGDHFPGLADWLWARLGASAV